MKASPLKVVVDEVSGCVDIEQLRCDWELLLSLWDTPSFSLSWLWIGNWIKIISSDVHLYRVTVYRDNHPEALMLVTSQCVKRKGVFSSHILALNESLAPSFDMMIEYNGIVGNRTNKDIYRLILSGLKEQIGRWDELQLSAVCEKDLFLDKSLLAESKLSLKLISESYARFVDLISLREKQHTYISSLRSKTRSRIRRYIRAFEEFGVVKVCSPNSVDEALEFFAELKSLHQSYWQSRGQSGSFANPAWEMFHQNIIREGFADGGIQILKIEVGSDIIGVVYSVVSDGTVNMIQSGFNYRLFQEKRPGYVCFVKVIEYNLDAGNNVFDFLAGDAQYKKSLATDAVKLKWVMLQRHRIKLSIENILRRLKHTVQGDSDLTF